MGKYLRDSHVGQSAKTIDELIQQLQVIKDKYGRGDLPVTMLMEPFSMAIWFS